MAIAAPTGKGGDALSELTRLHSALGLSLREQRQQLAQRELLLDTVVQNTPLALLLVDAQGRVAFANTAARQLLAQGRSLGGTLLADLLAHAPTALAQALHSQQDQLFTIPEATGEENFHLSQRSLQLQGRPHRLILLRRMTRELARQEVASWKRVIRVISHELNNSLAPISSLAHSGAELARRGDLERLPGVLSSIAERASHLHGFLSGYASFAKLPTPRREAVSWSALVARLAAHCEFQVLEPLPAVDASFDAPQIEQALINLVKNAHEAGSPPEGVSLQVQSQGEYWRVSVADRGPGMNEAVLSQALLPFYSTKRSGTGLGLALAREIVEAHGGRITLANRSGGGLRVSLMLPRT
jgi:nitrogen fixation/metabolism regulation signal transduction histidine kinase